MPTITMEFPKLKKQQELAVNAALLAAQAGLSVLLALRYEKQTNAKPRIAGVDYRQLIGVEQDVLIGRVIRVSYNKKGEPYVLLDATLTRAPIDAFGETTGEPGYTAVKPEGVKEAQILSVTQA